MSVTYLEADQAIASGNIDTIRQLITRDAKTMIKSLLYANHESMAIAAITEFGPSSSDGYAARKLSIAGLMKIIHRLSFDEVTRGCVYDTVDKSRANAVYEYYTSCGTNVFCELVKNVNRHKSTALNELIGKFAASVYDGTVDIVDMIDGHRLIATMMPYLSPVHRIHLMSTAVKYHSVECFKAIASDRSIPVKTLIESVCRTGHEDLFGVICHHYGGNVVMRSVSVDDIDSLSRCGSLEILKTLGTGVIRHRANPSSMMYYAAYNNHTTVVAWILEIFPETIIKAAESAVKGMSKDVLVYIISHDPVSTMSYIPESIADYLLKNMTKC